MNKFLIGLTAMATAAPLFAQDSPASATSTTNSPAAVSSTNAVRTGGFRGQRRRTVDLGPVPEVHAPVPNTLPGLLGKPLKWKSSGILVAPQNDSTHILYSIKDPTIFRYHDRWEVYATANMVSGPGAAALLNPGTNEPAPSPRRGGGSFFLFLSCFAVWFVAPV